MNEAIDVKSTLIDNMLSIFLEIGIPLDGLTKRTKDMMALTTLAVAGIFVENGWIDAKGIADSVSYKTRDIINLLNEKYGENISSGSYDDIRRKHLKLQVLAGIVVNTRPNSARNDPQRGYALSDDFKNLLVNYGQDSWDSELGKYKRNHSDLDQILNPTRELEVVPVKVNGVDFTFSPGEHNILQQKIVEEFLPRFGQGSNVLYLGDTADKMLVYDKAKLQELGFSDLEHKILPDVIAYTETRNWVYLIEAVYTSGPVSNKRKLDMKNLISGCSAGIIYVTAFLDIVTFRKFSTNIAWETEVWIADEPDHLIHFNGDRFLGPH